MDDNELDVATLSYVIEQITEGETDTTTDLSGDDYRWYLYGQAEVATWLRNKLVALQKGGEKNAESAG